jgi:alkylated DNA repair protein alkB family protein 1
MGYADAQEGAHSRTAFRNAEKKYKRYTHASSNSKRSRRKEVPATDVSEVLDFRKIGAALNDGDCSVEGVSRLEDVYDWPVYTLDSQPGFYFIPDALSKAQQLHWTIECLTSFPQPPNRTNHNALYGPIANLWAAFQEGKVLVERHHTSPSSFSETDNCESTNRQRGGELADNLEDPLREDKSCSRINNEDGGATHRPEKSWEFQERTDNCEIAPFGCVSAENLVRKLRWATVGLQFNWSKRAYNESLPFQEIPTKLAELAARLAKPAMQEGTFKAEAAIVNFYGPDDMLGGHVDDMEADMSKPIVSISLGCKAIFLLGGSSRDTPPAAMFVRSGDVVLMAGSARHCFHGMPRIFSEDAEAEVPDFTTVPYIDKNYINPILSYLKQSRINVNIRQVH